MDLVDLVVHGVPAAWDALWRFLLTPSLTMSPMGLLGTVLIAHALTGWLAEHGWRIPWLLATVRDWLVCHLFGHRNGGRGWCGRCAADMSGADE